MFLLIASGSAPKPVVRAVISAAIKTVVRVTSRTILTLLRSVYELHFRVITLSKSRVQSNSGTPLNDSLEKILRGQPINYEAFLKKLPEAFRRRHRELFATEKVQSNRWLVTVQDETAFAELQILAEAPASRIDAAKKGDSHRHGTEAVFFWLTIGAGPAVRMWWSSRVIVWISVFSAHAPC